MSAGPVTPSEAYLEQLCSRSFLRLWSHANLFRDQKQHAKASHGKELCDLLVVFGDDVLIFSDKQPRWYKKAILDSEHQIRGAERWIREHPARIFMDRACRDPFPLAIPEKPRFHRIVTCRGAAAASQAHYGGDGSIIITNGPLDDAQNTPFRLGSLANDGTVVHIFDEVALDAIFDALDTIADFCAYLARREAFLQRAITIAAAGEPDMLGAYLMHLDPVTGDHDFPADANATMVAIDEGFWTAWLDSPQRREKAKADAVSFAWDKLIEKFSFHMVTGTEYFTTGGSLSEREGAFRWMARENRTRRRMLASSLLELMRTVQAPGMIHRRLLHPSRPGDPYWVLLVFARPRGMDEDAYRLRRRTILESLLIAGKHLAPDAVDIVGIACDPIGGTISEDWAYLDARDWNADLARLAQDLHEKGGLFKTSRVPSSGASRA